MSGTIYVVGTPIGNLKDITIRALEILESVDFIAAEDTRVTVKLLNHYGIKKPLVSYHGHNFLERGPRIMERVLQGESCAVVSDAGMPCISDPGEELVKIAVDYNLDVQVVPGPSALISALCLSGMDASNFTFAGFLTINKTKRFRQLQKYATFPTTLIFYEAPHKLVATLRDMLSYFGNRKIAIAKELTKIHETVFRSSISEALVYYRQNRPLGEFVLIVEGAQEVEEEPVTLEQAIQLAKQELAEGVKATEAAKAIAKETGFSKSEIYKGLI